jgi:hypothetical protein
MGRPEPDARENAHKEELVVIVLSFPIAGVQGSEKASRNGKQQSLTNVVKR